MFNNSLPLREPQIDPISRFVEGLPRKPYCSADPRLYGVRIKPKEIALREAYLQPHHPQWASCIVFDLDRDQAAFAFEEAAMPAPTLTVVNPQTTHAHMVYLLERPAYRGNPKVDWLFGAVQSGLGTMLGADSGYGGVLVQNPLHPNWRTLPFDITYDLASLALEIPEEHLAPRRRLDRRSPIDVAGRNVFLFNEARAQAYSQVRQIDSEPKLYMRILAFIHARNTYSPPLPWCEVRSIARSVSRWTWKHREWLQRSDARKRRGILGFTPIQTSDPARRATEKAARQGAGARFAHAALRGHTDAALERAIEQLRAQGGALSVRSIARMADLSRATVRAHWQPSKPNLEFVHPNTHSSEKYEEQSHEEN